MNRTIEINFGTSRTIQRKWRKGKLGRVRNSEERWGMDKKDKI